VGLDNLFSADEYRFLVNRADHGELVVADDRRLVNDDDGTRPFVASTDAGVRGVSNGLR
jgi:hypothetical protein